MLLRPLAMRSLLRSHPQLSKRIDHALFGLRLQSTEVAAPVAVPHKPIPAKVKRKLSARHKGKSTTAAAIATKLSGYNGASATGGNTAHKKTKSQKQSEEHLLAQAAVASTSSNDGLLVTKVNGAMITRGNGSNNTKLNGSDKLNGEAAAASQVVDGSATAVGTELEATSDTSEAIAAPKKTPMTLRDAATEKITSTLQEIASLQNTLPSVKEIDALVVKLRRESFEKGYNLFDLYRHYGNPFLDESFLTPGVIACCEAQKPKEGIDIVRDMLNQGRKVDESTLRALFDACDATSAAEEVIELWRLMERAGVTLDLKDYNLLLDICYRKEYLDGAIQVLKQLRLHRSISVHTYMHWLLRSSLVWRSDAFFELLMEMRLSGVEPEIYSLTSLESGRKDRALTVMEGVRAVGLDPCFAMSAVFSSMQLSVYQNGPSAQIPSKDIKTALAKFGDLKPFTMEWPTKPIPQVLETQAAGLILQQETFRRLKRRQVHRIDELLQMLPITANMTLNLRKQLQRMSLLVNTHRVRRDTTKIHDEYNSGKSLIELSTVHNYPPVSLMRVILRARGLNTLNVKRALQNPADRLSKRDQHELRKAIEYDSVHKSDPFLRVPSYNPDSLESTIEHFLKSRGVRVKTEDDLCREQEQTYGRRVISPDILLLDPVVVNGTPIRWIDAKNYYGAHIVSKRLIAKQLESYVKEWGPGAIVFGMGYSDMFTVPGVICLDTTPFPKTRKEHFKMRVKSLFYSTVNVFRWKKHLGSELTQEYPVPGLSRQHSQPQLTNGEPEDDDQEMDEHPLKHHVKPSKSRAS